MATLGHFENLATYSGPSGQHFIDPMSRDGQKMCNPLNFRVRAYGYRFGPVFLVSPVEIHVPQVEHYIA